MYQKITPSSYSGVSRCHR